MGTAENRFERETKEEFEGRGGECSDGPAGWVKDGVEREVGL